MTDQETLAALQQIVRVKPYTYLEVGSYMGDSLIPHLFDPLCTKIISIDPRPDSTPDERGLNFEYNASTCDMLNRLNGVVPKAAMDKLEIYEGTLQDYVFCDDTPLPTLVFIDAEHTNEAVFRDALMAQKHLAYGGIIAFHDSNFVFDGLLNFAATLDNAYTAFLPQNVFVAAYENSAKWVRLLPAHDPKEYVKRVRAALHEEIARNVMNPPNGAMWGPIRVR